MVLFISGIRALVSRAKAKKEPEGLEVAAGPPAGSVLTESLELPLTKRNARTYAREAAALLLIASGLYCALALASYQADPMRVAVHGDNWVGPVGEVFARASVGLIGVVAWLIPLELVLLARPLLFDKRLKLSITRMSGDVVVTVILAALMHIAVADARAFGQMPLGGAVGELFGEVSRGLFSTIGSFLIGLTVVALILVERATFSFIDVAQRIQKRVRKWSGDGAGAVGKAWREARVADKEQREAEQRASEPLIASPEQADAIIAAFADDGDSGLPRFVPPRRAELIDSHADNRISRPPVSDAPQKPATATLLKPTARRKVIDVAVEEVPTPSPIMPVDTSVVDDAALTPSLPAALSLPAAQAEASPDKPDSPKPDSPNKKAKRRERKSQGPKIVDTSLAAKTTKASRRRCKKSEFQLPMVDLLDPVIVQSGGQSPAKLKETARLLEKTLLDYRVDGKVHEIHPGPTVTMFELSPAAGTKVSKVAGLADDLALGLSRKVRIVAPIPGKNRIGFEVPNDKRQAVSLRELIESEDFMGLDVPLPVVLGRDIIGRPFFGDLSAMPHVIVAGATGAGKSVGLNVMLTSLLFRRTPEELRLLMIDPKVVELAPYDNIPHLLFPVVTDMKQASNALKWTVDEMERRYQLFADAGTRGISTYNRYVTRVAAGEVEAPPIPHDQDAADVEPKKLPYIVIVIEEFADLMMTQGKDVESSVARLAQKARAAGLHVILATQRPSVNVITGIIKANFPTRIAYRVTQRVDSRTILDEQGAEHLLGRGDMLVKLNGTNDVKRVQCPFVSEDEVQRVTDMLRTQGKPDYDETIVLSRDDEEKKSDPGDAETDPLYDQAVSIVAETKKCSTSWIQRKLGIGYNRAAKIVETMEKHGIVGPPNGSKPREILISSY
jgi:S-DNA-T family DNA segregation ATPase FtsK/SpoIIIE